MKCMWGIPDLMDTRKLNQSVSEIWYGEKQFGAERDKDVGYRKRHREKGCKAAGVNT